METIRFASLSRHATDDRGRKERKQSAKTEASEGAGRKAKSVESKAEPILRRIPLHLLDIGVAMLAGVVSVMLRGSIAGIVEYRQPYITAYPILLAIALFRSTRAAVYFLAIAALAHFYYFVEPVYSLRILRPVEGVVLFAFLMVSAIIVGLVHAHQRERRRLVVEVTERRRAEDEVLALNEELEDRVEERTQQLTEANRELEAFSYSVSHDLRAPLRHIAGFTDMLEKRIGGSLDDSGRRYMGIIQDAVSRAGSLVDDLLAFSRMGRADLMQTRIPMGAMVQEILRDFSEETRGREIEWKVQEDLPDVHADPSMLRQVWRNLISNAVKYTRQQPKPVIEIGTDPKAGNPDELTYYVRDNGVGFDMKYADKLFGVFQRLHRSDEFEGTGIGLANVKRIIQRHGGRAWAQASPGKGATFYFTLPGSRERTEA